MVCRIIAVHHLIFSADIGQEVVISKLASLDLVWIYKNKSVEYRTTRTGRRVIAHDPRCFLRLVSTRELKRVSSAPCC